MELAHLFLFSSYLLSTVDSAPEKGTESLQLKAKHENHSREPSRKYRMLSTSAVSQDLPFEIEM